MTQFCNIATGELYGQQWPDGYFVDGKPGTPPDGSFEATLIYADAPTPSLTQKIVPNNTPDVDAKTYTFGWSLVDMTRDEIVASLPTICNAQMQLWLERNGLLETIRGFVNGITDDTARIEAQIRFKSQASIVRTGAFIEVIRQRMGWTHEFVDNAFREASLL